MVYKENINKMFREFRKAGYYAKQDFWCCQSCGWSALTDQQAEKAIFYHRQDKEGAFDGVRLVDSLMLAWSGDGNEICNILKNYGLKVEWDGSPDKRIAILP